MDCFKGLISNYLKNDLVVFMSEEMLEFMAATAFA